MSSTKSTGNYNAVTHQNHSLSVVPMSVRPKLLQYVEEHITSLIQDAVSIQRHTKRARLNHLLLQGPTNHNDAPIAGAAATAKTNHNKNSNHNSNTNNNNNNNNSTSYFKTRLHAADINLALQLKGCEKLYGNNTTTNHTNNLMTTTTTTTANQKIMLTDLLKEDIPLPPEEVSMKQHWLVIDGLIPNSTGSATNTNTTALSSSSSDNDPYTTATSSSSFDLHKTYESSDVLLRIHQLQSGLLSEELKLYFLRVIRTLEQHNMNTTVSVSSTTNHNSNYEKYEQDQIIAQLQIDDGLQELVPFFIRYAQHAIYEHIQRNNLESCILIVRFIRALLHNPTIHLELHLHEILPSLMTCVVAKSFGSGTSSVVACNMNHYTLRNESAITLAICTDLFSKDYATLKSRILRTLCQALEMNSDHNLSSRYGGIIAITLFGNRAIDAFVLPLITDCWEVWEEEIGKPTSSSLLEMEIIMCQYAVLNSMSTYLQSTTIEERSGRLVDLQMTEILGGDRMMLLTSDYQTEYNMCFV